MLSKKQAKVFFLGGTILFSVLFLGLSYDTVANRVGDQTHEENLTEEVVKGRELWDANNCMGCHTLMGEGAYYAPELTKVIDRRGAPFVQSVLMSKEPWTISGRKMVAYGFSEEEAKALVAFFTWVGEADLNGFPAEPTLNQDK